MHNRRRQDLNYRNLITFYNKNTYRYVYVNSTLSDDQKKEQNKEILARIIRILAEEEANNTSALQESMTSHVSRFGNKILNDNLQAEKKRLRTLYKNRTLKENLEAEWLKAQDTYLRLLNEVQTFAEHFASDIAKRYTDEITAIESYGCETEHKILDKLPSRLSIEGKEKYHQQDLKTFIQINPELNNNAAALNTAILQIENDDELKECCSDRLQTLKTTLRNKIAKSKLDELDKDPELKREIRISNDKSWIEQQIKEGKFHTYFESKDPRKASHYIPSKSKNIFLPTIQAIGISETLNKLKPNNTPIENLTTAEYENRTRAALESLTGKRDVHEARNSRKEWKKLRTEFCSAKNQELKQEIKQRKTEFPDITQKKSAIADAIMHKRIKAQFKYKEADVKLIKGTHLKKPVESLSYLDYIKQDQNPLVRYFDMAILMIRSLFSGTITKRKEASKNHHGHERFWKSPTSHLSHSVKKVKNQITQIEKSRTLSLFSR